ncbi:MAG: purine-nucleoside phosphorylase [Bacteroidetes bacterium]|nr:purine-nucleoside phosphorylase [Bacteroidota bacterium]
MTNRIGIILGSGLGRFAEMLTERKTVYSDTDSFHKMKILTGKINSKEIILFAGRRHFYEGYNPGKILEFVDIAEQYGVNLLIISNAAGGLNRNFNVSDLMLITSHLNFINKILPLKRNVVPYTRAISETLSDIAVKNGINLRKGSYCCFSGPNYETKSEIRYVSKFRIDAVGMSTVPEVLYASGKGISTIAISCITNLLSSGNTGVTDHNEVIEAGNKAYENFSKMLISIIENSGKIITN